MLLAKSFEPKIRTGSGSTSTRPAGTAQIGNAWGDHVTHRGDSTGYRGEKRHGPDRNFQPTKFGNEVALNVGKGGCGTGRTIYKTGTQANRDKSLVHRARKVAALWTLTQRSNEHA
jgi:hypothetical protein